MADGFDARLTVRPYSGTMPARHFLRCLGIPELRGPSGDPIRFRTRKHLALLVFLAAERRQAHPRERLAELLWPDARPSEGRHSVATALSVIRGKLGPRTFETTRDTVRLLAPDLEVDLERLGRGDVLGDEQTPPLDVAGFLDEFEVTRAPEYMLWRDIMRARWFPEIRSALILLMDRCRRTGDFTRIETHADRLLVLDELSEDGIRGKMEARAFAGDRLSSLRIFQAWRQRLHDELDATPSRLVEGMALRLRQRGYEPPGTSHIPTVPTDQWRNRAFVGRASQYRSLYERWERSNKGEGRHGLVLGESGIGKTTLVERLVTAAGLEGAISSRVQCYEAEREIPYAAVGTLVRGLLDQPGASGTPPEWLAELAQNIPAVARRFPNLPPARESVGETARLRLTEAFHELTSSIAEEHPVILVVDDVHLADDASVAVLHLIMRRTQEQKVMVIMTARESELARSPHAGRLMESRESLALAAVELPPLTEEEMNEVVTALASDAPLPPAVRQAMLRAANGIPMLAELLFDDWRSNGEHCLALSVGAMTVDALGQVEHELYHRIFDRVFRDLSPAARAVVNLAAILGDRLNDLAMYELVDLTLAQTLAGMSELASHRVLRDGGREVEFRNELLRNYTYLHVPSPLRRALHGLIADRLLRAEANGEKVPGLMLAWHCFRAGRPVEAEPYLLRGSSEALRRGGVFEVELALTSAMAGLTRGNVHEARLLLAEALQEQGRWADALQVLGPVPEDDGNWPNDKNALVLRARSALLTDESEARETLRDLRGFLTRITRPRLQAWAMEAMYSCVLYLEDAAEGESLFRDAELLVTDSNDLRAKIVRNSVLGYAAWLTKRTAQIPGILSSLDQLTEECHRAGILESSLGRLHNVAGCLYASQGQYERGLPHFLLTFSLAKKHGHREREGGAANNVSICLGRLGQYDEQYLWATRAGALLGPKTDAWLRTHATLRVAWSLSMRGESNRALEIAAPFLKPVDFGGRSWASQAAGLLASDILQACGEHKRAQALARETLQITGRSATSLGYVGSFARWLALTAQSESEVESTLQTLAKQVECLAQFDVLDQMEISSANLWLTERSGRLWKEGRGMLQDLLSRLPAAVEVQTRRLGTLA